MPHQIQLAQSLAVPASGTYLHPFSVRITNRRDEPTSPAGAIVYVRLVDNDGAAITGKLGNTSGTALSASTSDAFPSASGWYALGQSTIGLHEGCVIVASGVTAGPVELQLAWSVDGVQANARASAVFAGSSSVDLSEITDALGASTDDQAGTTVHARINKVRDDIAGLTDPGTIAATLGTPTAAATVTALLEVPILAYGTVTTATGTGTVTSTAFIGRDLINELLIIEDVSAGMTPPLRSSRTIASFNSGTGACTVAALNFSPAVGDKVWVVPRAQTGP